MQRHNCETCNRMGMDCDLCLDGNNLIDDGELSVRPKKHLEHLDYTDRESVRDSCGIRVFRINTVSDIFSEGMTLDEEI